VTHIARSWGVSQLAVATVGIFSLTPPGVAGALVQPIGAGICATALVLAASAASGRTAGVLMLAVALASIGLGQILIVQGSFAVGSGWGIAAVLAVALAAVPLLRLAWQTMTSSVRFDASVPARRVSRPEAALLAALVALAVGVGVRPQPVLRLTETSMGRVVARANPVYAPAVAQGSDCATPAPPEPAGPPPSFLLTAPCTDADSAAKPERAPR
jgi:NADH-quinone oxidoreductase subunit M